MDDVFVSKVFLMLVVFLKCNSKWMIRPIYLHRVKFIRFHHRQRHSSASHRSLMSFASSAILSLSKQRLAKHHNFYPLSSRSTHTEITQLARRDSQCGSFHWNASKSSGHFGIWNHFNDYNLLFTWRIDTHNSSLVHIPFAYWHQAFW